MTASGLKAWRRFWPSGCLGNATGRDPSSIRSCLLVLVAICLVPPTLAAALVIVQAYRDGRAALVGRAEGTARSLMAEVDDRIRGAMSALQVLATSPSLASGDLQAFREQAERVVPYQAGNNVVLSDLQGRQLVNTLVGGGEPLPAHGNPALQSAVIATARPAVSDLFIGGVTRRPLVAVEVPVLIDGRVAYTLAMGFFPDRFGQLLANLQPEADWIIAVFDRTGTTVARTHLAERFIGQKGVPGLMAAIARSDHGVLELDTLEGTPVFSVFQRSAVSGWTVAIGVPKQTLLARLRLWVTVLAMASALLLALAIGIAGRVSRRIAGAIESLVPPAQALGRGDEVDVPRLPLEEADALGRAMVSASQLLRERTHQLGEATQETQAARVQARRLEHEASHDPLTDLPNRARFMQLVAGHLERYRGEGVSFAVCFVDLDDFKPVNDRHGHQVGDKLLHGFAARLAGGVRGSDHVGRLGGDEFAVLLDDVSPEQARAVAGILTQRLSSPYVVDGLELRVSACIGVACCPWDGTTAEALLAAADAAMYRAKAAGKGRYEMSGFGAL
ncbi:diguanylate cyclase [Ideonella sp. YS5]|uniref:diguanylate cyclase n=1 Tax=Ideonella sp. YS5 TaxID=3453714 RepID=UPI003EECA01C